MQTIRRIRHAAVMTVWRVVDAVNDKVAVKASLPQGIREIKDSPYTSGNNADQVLDVYTPAEGGPYPVIVYIHGGGFVAGDKHHFRQYGMTLAQEGYAVFNLNYRLAPQHKNPAQIADVMAAVNWVHEHAAAYGGDSGKMVLAGDSAGAYLAAMAANLCTNEPLADRLGLTTEVSGEAINGIILFCGLFDIQTAARRKFPGIKSNIEMALGTGDTENYPDIRAYSIPENVTENYPPVFIASGEVDGLHPESVAMVDALMEKGLACEALLFGKDEKKAFHAFQARLELPTAKTCFQKVIAFLETVTNDGVKNR